MQPIDIIEEIEVRRWYSEKLLRHANEHVKFWWLKSFIIFIAAAFLYKVIDVPKTYYTVAFLVAFLPLLGFATPFYILYPSFLFPQHWQLQDGKVSGKGGRYIGSFKTKHIQEWSIQEISDLPNHSIARVKWKCWAGIQQGDIEILITEQIQVAQVEKYFQKNNKINCRICR